MGFFDAIGGIDPSGTPPRFPHGTYVVRIHEVRTNQGQWGLRYIVECEVLSSDNPEVPEGARRSWTVQIDGAYGKLGMGEVKTFVGAALGLDPSDKDAINAQVTGPLCDSTCSPAQPLKGRVVKTEVSIKPTKTGHEIAKHLWFPVDAATAVGSSVAPPAVAVPPPPAAAGAPPPPPAPVAKPFPPPGWTAHPTSPGWYYRGNDVVSEADLRSRS